MDPLWYVGNVPRAEAEQMLAACGAHVLLVRDSSVQGNYALSFYDADTNLYRHELVMPVRGGFQFKDCATDTNVYRGIADLIQRSEECIGFDYVGNFSEDKNSSFNNAKAPVMAPKMAPRGPPPPAVSVPPRVAPPSSYPQIPNYRAGPPPPSNFPPPPNITRGVPPPPPITQSNAKTDMDPSWFYGDISRMEAETILTNTGVSSLLIRKCSVGTHYALSRYDSYTNLFSHQLIAPTIGGYQLEDCPTDNTIYEYMADIIQYSPECEGFVPAGTVRKMPPAKSSGGPPPRGVPPPQGRAGPPPAPGRGAFAPSFGQGRAGQGAQGARVPPPPPPGGPPVPMMGGPMYRVR